MATDIEEQLQRYFGWIEEQSGGSLRGHPDDSALAARPVAAEAVTDIVALEFYVRDDRLRERNRRRIVVAAAAAVALVVTAAVLRFTLLPERTVIVNTPTVPSAGPTSPSISGTTEPTTSSPPAPTTIASSPTTTAPTTTPTSTTTEVAPIVVPAGTETPLMITPAPGEPVEIVRFNADATKLSITTRNSTDPTTTSLTVWDTANGQQVALEDLQTTTDTFIDDRWSIPGRSHDGRRLIKYASRYRLSVIDALTNDVISTLIGHTFIIFTASFSPDDTRVLTGSEDGSVRVWDVATGAQLLQLAPLDPSGTSAWYNDTGNRIISTGVFTELWDADTGERVATLDEPIATQPIHGPEPTVQPIITPGCPYVLAYTDFGGPLARWDATTGRALDPIGSSVFSASVSADGTRIATNSGDGTITIWDTKSGNGLTSIPFTDFEGLPPALVISPDGSHLAAIWGATVTVWALP